MMTGWDDVYKVVVAMAPLYFALALGYGSMLWWKLFTPDQCGAVNHLVIYFAFPFSGFDLTARAGTFTASYRVLAADIVSKLLVLALAGWAAACHWSTGRRRKGGNDDGAGGGGGCSYALCIIGFLLVALNNAFFMGISLLDAMYGKWAHDIAVQMSMMQIVVWFPLMLVVFEVRKAWLMPIPDDGACGEDSCSSASLESNNVCQPGDDRKTTGWSF